MSRRRRATKRKASPDQKYNNTTLSKFINRVMLHGKKSLATRIVYQALDVFAKKVNAKDPIIAFDQAMENAMPTLEVKSRRIGGATYQVPIEIPTDRRASMGMKWIIMHARKKPGHNMIDSLAMELADCFNNQGSTIKKKDDTHRMAESNKAFAHYKW
ncbi:MAG: 30S ribosomal protein S7 [Simkaniaceae bacterium]|nr:30S ribosomal protein S7 [Simkaniaceae bacterium]